MKQLILNALKAKFEGVSEQILNRIADKIAKTVTKEEDVNTAVEAVTIQQVIEGYGDSRATEAQQTAVTNYEKKYGLKDGKPETVPVETPPATPPAGADEPVWIKKLNERLDGIDKVLGGYQAEKTTSSRTEKLNAALEGAPEALKASYSKTIPLLNFEKEEDYDAYLETLKVDLKPVIEAAASKGSVFGIPPVNNNHQKEEDKVPKALQDYFDKKNEKDGQKF